MNLSIHQWRCLEREGQGPRLPSVHGAYLAVRCGVVNRLAQGLMASLLPAQHTLDRMDDQPILMNILTRIKRYCCR